MFPARLRTEIRRSSWSCRPPIGNGCGSPSVPQHLCCLPFLRQLLCDNKRRVLLLTSMGSLPCSYLFKTYSGPSTCGCRFCEVSLVLEQSAACCKAAAEGAESAVEAVQTQVLRVPALCRSSCLWKKASRAQKTWHFWPDCIPKHMFGTFDGVATRLGLPRRVWEEMLHKLAPGPLACLAEDDASLLSSISRPFGLPGHRMEDQYFERSPACDIATPL